MIIIPQTKTKRIMSLSNEILTLIFDYVRDLKTLRSISASSHFFLDILFKRLITKRMFESLGSVNQLSTTLKICLVYKTCQICHMKYNGVFTKQFGGIYAHGECIGKHCVNEYYLNKKGMDKHTLDKLPSITRLKTLAPSRYITPRTFLWNRCFWEQISECVPKEFTVEFQWKTNAAFRERTETNLMSVEDKIGKKAQIINKRKRKFDEKWEIRENKRQALHNTLRHGFRVNKLKREAIVRTMMRKNNTDYFKFKKHSDTKLHELIENESYMIDNICKSTCDIVEDNDVWLIMYENMNSFEKELFEKHHSKKHFNCET